MDISSIGNSPVPVNAGTTPALPPATQGQRTLIQAVKSINAAEIFGEENELTFIIDRGTGRAIARIVNRNTHEVVQQFPPEYLLRLAEKNP